MNNKIKLLAAFAVGAVAGAGTTYILTAKKKDKAVRVALDTQRELYEKRIEKIQNGELDGKVEAEVDVVETVEVPEELKNGLDEESSDDIMRSVNTHRTNYAKKVSELGYKEEAGDESPAEPEYHESPYIISEESYSEDRLNYDKKQITYFEMEGVLVDSDSEFFEPMDVSNTVMWKNLNEFEKDRSLEELYVRNDLMGCDYFIQRCRAPMEEVE